MGTESHARWRQIEYRLRGLELQFDEVSASSDQLIQQIETVGSIWALGQNDGRPTAHYSCGGGIDVPDPIHATESYYGLSFDMANVGSNLWEYCTTISYPAGGTSGCIPVSAAMTFRFNATTCSLSIIYKATNVSTPNYCPSFPASTVCPIPLLNQASLGYSSSSFSNSPFGATYSMVKGSGSGSTVLNGNTLFPTTGGTSSTVVSTLLLS